MAISLAAQRYDNSSSNVHGVVGHPSVKKRILAAKRMQRTQFLSECDLYRKSLYTFSPRERLVCFGMKYSHKGIKTEHDLNELDKTSHLLAKTITNCHLRNVLVTNLIQNKLQGMPMTESISKTSVAKAAI